jgi:hypothetical protein
MLTQQHQTAVKRSRRIIVQYDAVDPVFLIGTDFLRWKRFRFDFLDDPAVQVDSIIWDIAWGNSAIYPSSVLSPDTYDRMKAWHKAGIDPVKEVVDECHQRGLEAIWNHRISEVDVNHKGDFEMKERFSVKAKHPDWTLKTWWWHGLWNLASSGLRKYKLRILRELAESYEFDGFQIDFSRHTPCLPEGRQWELRGHVTEFIRQVRHMLLAVAARKGRPILLAVKIPENIDGCHTDGFDVEVWAKENLVDIFSLGSRTLTVDVQAFRKITAGRNIKIYPCLDDHHATDGYKYPPIEVFRGVFSNWLQQGADGIETFNWQCRTSSTNKVLCDQLKVPVMRAAHSRAYREGGSLKTMDGKDKIFVVERRGGYPWSEGYFNQNLTLSLPAVLANDARPLRLILRVGEDPKEQVKGVAKLFLRLVLFGAGRKDQMEVRWNGTALKLKRRDFHWKDGQIVSPKPTPPSGADCYPIDPQQKLVLLEFVMSPEQVRLGENKVEVRIMERGPHMPCADIQVEKVELHVKHRKSL